MWKYLIGLLIILNSCTHPTEMIFFENMPSSTTNIHFTNSIKNDSGLSILAYNYFYNGGGIAAADFNNDGLTDLYFTGNQTSNRLYLNKGNFSFTDITNLAGVETTNWATGVSVADVNNDGLQDMYVSYAGYDSAYKRQHQLFINKGIDSKGIPVFKDEAVDYGLADTSYTTQSVFIDYDKDGDMDLLLINHTKDNNNPNLPREKNNKDFLSSRSKLFRNDYGKFVDISAMAGINEEGFGLGISVSDINQDGWSDIYITKDFIFDDALYINNKNGTFTESLHKYIKHTSQFSMGCDISDFNNDAYPDIITVDMLPDDNKRQKLMNIAMNNDRFNYALSLGYMPQYSRNMLHLNNGPNGEGQYSFSEIGQLAGVFKTDWSWSPLFADFDNDGWKDLFISNGIPRDITNNDFLSYRDDEIKESSKNFKEIWNDLLVQIEKLDPVNKANFIFQNNKDLTFTDQSKNWGLDYKGFSNGSVYVDLDNDGDLDLVTNNINDKASVFKNNSNLIVKNNYIRVKLNGNYAIGATISINCKGKKQFIEHQVCRGFQSSQDPVDHFGLGKDSMIDTLFIKWLDSKQQTLTNIKANQLIILDYKNASVPPSVNQSGNAKLTFPIFKDVTNISGINFTQVENQFEDFDYEPLLPHRFSRNGPYMAIADVDENGEEDFWIGGPAKMPGKLFLQKGGKFISRDMPDAGYEDMGAVFFDANGDKHPDLYVVSGGSEYNANTATYQDRLYMNDGKGNFKNDVDALPVEVSSGSVVVANDYDKDGDMDIFVGGRVVPGNYPRLPQSFILQNDGKGKFKDVTNDVCSELSNIGMVTSAIWSDFDKDGWTDLIVTGEWMPIAIFKNKAGKLTRIQSNPVLDASTGWWNCIAAGDFDNDGDTDYIAGNLGLNNKFNASDKTPVSVYANDFDGSGNTKPILTYFLNNKEFTVAGRDQIASVLPSIKKKFDTYTKFADAEFNQIFSKDQLQNAQVYKATHFASTYLENEGNGKFSMHALPLEAQFSTIQSLQISDFNFDGNLDALISGNFYSPDFMIGRYDASNGLLLKGNGKGKFQVQSAKSSGIYIEGDARSSAVIHINNKLCLLAAINSGKLKVFELQSVK